MSTGKKRPPLIQIESHFPWQIVGADITEPHKILKNGNRYILVFVDLLTKYVVAKAIPNMKAETVAKAFYQEIVCDMALLSRFYRIVEVNSRPPSCSSRVSFLVSKDLLLLYGIQAVMA